MQRPTLVPQRPYRGRFAPTPSGPLHAGSLCAALISFLDARCHQGSWSLRIEDCDRLREQPGAAKAILDTLTVHGLHWDGAVVVQSRRRPAYHKALVRLRRHFPLFICGCSRTSFQALGGHSTECQSRWYSDDPRVDQMVADLASCEPQARPYSLRVHLSPIPNDPDVDLLQGTELVVPSTPSCEAVLIRKEGYVSNLFAGIVDDVDLGVTAVIRGVDLVSLYGPQKAIAAALTDAPPQFGHFPVLVDASGRKLGKSTSAPALDLQHPVENFRNLLALFGLPHKLLERATTVEKILDIAMDGYRREWLRGTSQLVARTLQ